MGKKVGNPIVIEALFLWKRLGEAYVRKKNMGHRDDEP